MSLAKINTNQIFESRLQVLHEQMDPVLQMLFNLTKAEQVFLTFWNDDYSQVYNHKSGFSQAQNLDGSQLKQKFKSLYSDVIYIPNARLHTLIQDIQFFTDSDYSTNIFIFPLINSEENRVGVVGLSISNEIVFEFDQIVSQIEIVGQHIINIFENQLKVHSSHHIKKIDLDHLPVSFLNFRINKNADLLDCNFSKHLIRNHPIFVNYSGNSSELIEPLLQMDLSSFTKMVLRSNNDQSIEYVYPYLLDGQEKKYFLIKLHVSLSEDGVYNCLALIDDISIHRKYNATLDQILFDISHVMRRPVVSMKGLTNLIDLNQFDRNELYEISGKIKLVSEEMEDYIRAMFKIYEAKQSAEYNL